MGIYSEKAVNNFKTGYNCAQSVFLAFAEDFGLDKGTALKLSSSFGGGGGGGYGRGADGGNGTGGGGGYFSPREKREKGREEQERQSVRIQPFDGV